MQFSPIVSYLLIVVGFMLNSLGLVQIGILFYGVVVLFMVLTLPVEIDASRRGLKMLSDAGLMMAAALTYVATAVTALLNLLYYISLLNRRR